MESDHSRIRAAFVLMTALALASCREAKIPKPSPTQTPVPTRAETPTPTPTPTPLPEAFIPSSRMETARLFNSLQLHSRVVTVEGPPASVGRKNPDAYQLDLELKVEVPRAAQTIEELSDADPEIGSALPGLKEQLVNAKISKFYYGLYQLKVDSVNRLLARLDQLISRHNFFDCNTILEIQDAKSLRKALLIQSDMDVNADGSDSDRQSDVDGSSTNFQPYTSYRWPKKTEKPSQFLPERESKLKQLQADYDAKGTPPDKKKSIKDQIDQIQREIADLKKYSYLISKYDPFVVLPGFMLRQPTHPFVPKLGDYVVVIYKGTLYPALLGDVGPSYKIGEGSLRISTQSDPRSNPYNRPSSNLNITYLVFPGSSEEPSGPPNLKKLHDKCASLLGEVGGYGGQLWEWEDLLAQPSQSPSPSASASPQSSIVSNSTPNPSGSVTPSLPPEPSPISAPSPTGSGSPGSAAKESQKKHGER
jgi:Fungal chitosanase of glycosyl hydrolase group 75